jgi:DNA-binding response OmpR family regulator
MNPPPQILVVDDERDTRDFIVRLLHRQNYHLSTISSGEDALIFLEAHPETEIILLDLMMPGLDGFEVLEMIKSNPATAQIRVIMLTATNRVEDKISAFTLGAADYLVKPFERGELIARIETHVKLKRAETTLAASETRYRTIIDHANDAIFILKDYRFVFANQAIRKKFWATPKSNFSIWNSETCFPRKYYR